MIDVILSSNKKQQSALVNEQNRIIDAIGMSRPYSLADKPPLTHELIWALSSSVPDSSLYAAASVCQNETNSRPLDNNSKQAAGVGAGADALFLHPKRSSDVMSSSMFHPNISATVSDGETTTLNYLHTHPLAAAAGGTKGGYNNSDADHTTYQPSLNAILITSIKH